MNIYQLYKLIEDDTIVTYNCGSDIRFKVCEDKEKDYKDKLIDVNDCLKYWDQPFAVIYPNKYNEEHKTEFKNRSLVVPINQFPRIISDYDSSVVLDENDNTFVVTVRSCHFVNVIIKPELFSSGRQYFNFGYSKLFCTKIDDQKRIEDHVSIMATKKYNDWFFKYLAANKHSTEQMKKQFIGNDLIDYYNKLAKTNNDSFIEIGKI